MGLQKGWGEKRMETSCWKFQFVSTTMNINIAYTPRTYTYASTQFDISLIFISLSTLQMTTSIICYLRENSCAHHADRTMERLDDLAQTQSLWQNHIHEIWSTWLFFVLVCIERVLLSVATEGLYGISQKSLEVATEIAGIPYFLALFDSQFS